MNPEIKLSSPETREFWKIPILFQDDYLLAIQKPARLLVSPDRYDPARANIMMLLHRDIARQAVWVRENRVDYLANAHRLDFETTGVLLLAKTKPALIQMANQFGSEKINKTYLALAQGAPPEDQFTVEAKLGPHPIKIGLIRVDEKNGKRSRTDFEVSERYSRYTLIRCHPRTGRTHQIRVHLQSRGLPIVADTLYGGAPFFLSSLKKDYRLKNGRDEVAMLSRLALHAETLSFAHPISGETVTITAPIPKDLTVALKYLRRYSPAGSPVGQHFDQANPEEDGDDQEGRS